MFEELGLLFFTVLILSLLFTPLSVMISHRIGAIDHPVDRSVHSRPMPRLGGLGMALSVLVGMLMFLQFEPVFIAFMVGLSLIIITGATDDVYQIRPLFKMAGQIIACVLFIELSGLQLNSLGDIFNLGEVVFTGPISYMLTIFCMVGIINAFNLSDGLDGLAAGIVAIICFFLAFFALKAQAWEGLTIVVTVLASVIGFLKFNSHPARLFMGDTGSLMLGFSMASLIIILLGLESKGEIKPISLAIILALPIIDTLWVMTRRIMQGKSPATADKTHLHHRLLALGLSHSLVVTILYGWVIALGSLALTMRNMPDYWQLVLGIALSGAFYCILTLYERKPNHIPFNNAKELTVHLLGLSMKVLPYIIILGLCLPLLIADSVPESLNKLTLGLAIFVAAAFPWKNHGEYLNIIYGLFYLCGFIILYALNISSYHTFGFDLHKYIFGFGGILLIWAFMKVKFKRNSEIFLTSSFELLLIFISWFIPYIFLPAIEVSESTLDAAKLSCLGAIPLLIAMKLVIKKQPHRNRKMAISLILILVFIALRAS